MGDPHAVLLLVGPDDQISQYHGEVAERTLALRGNDFLNDELEIRTKRVNEAHAR